RHADGLIEKGADCIAEQRSGHRGQSADERIAQPLRPLRKHHRDEQHVGRDRKEGALYEGHARKPLFCVARRRQRHGIIVEFAKHRRPSNGGIYLPAALVMRNGRRPERRFDAVFSCCLQVRRLFDMEAAVARPPRLRALRSCPSDPFQKKALPGTMPRLVMKFGGTSVADIARIHNVARHVKREVDAGHEVAVVVSAMAGKTNELVALAREMPRATGASSPFFDAREYDAIVASGEQVASGLLAIALQSIGIDARSWQGWQIPIRTDNAHGAARILEIDGSEIIRR